MIDDKECEELIKLYYKEIYNYCLAKLNFSSHSAEDCTQEVFVAFFKKHKNLDLTENIRLWLYRTADLVIKSWLRKNETPISLENSVEAQNMAFEENFSDMDKISAFDILTTEETEILKAYYNSDKEEKIAAAKKLGLSLPSFYTRVHRIKKKLKSGRN